MSANVVAIICITVMVVAAIAGYCWCRYVSYKTIMIRRNNPMNLDNVPYSQQNIWHKETKQVRK